MISQTVSNTKNPYSDFNGFNKNPNFIMNTPSTLPQEDEKHNRTAAYSVGISALIIGFGILGLMRGSTKNLTKHLEKLKGYLESKIEKARNLKSTEWLLKGYTYTLNKVNALILKSESINNFTAIKDAGFKYIMGKTKVTKKIHEGITHLFKKISRARVINSWTNTTHKFKSTFSNLQDIDKRIFAGKENSVIEINGIKKTGKEWLETLDNHRTNILNTLKKNTSAEAIAKREKTMYEATNNLDKLTLAAIKRYKNPRLYRSYIADDFIVKSKENMFLDMTKFRQQISMNNNDKKNLALYFLEKAENLFLDGNTPILKHIFILRQAIKTNAPEKEIRTAMDNLSKMLEKSDIKTKVHSKAKNYLNRILPLLQNKNSGEIQEMLAIYQKAAPYEYDKILKGLSSSVKKLDSSVQIESIQYFEKLRDFQIGSAPTDVLSIAGSGGYIAYALSGHKDNDKKISVILREGIPVLSTIATSLFLAARLVSGSKAMAAGLFSGWIMNRFGSYTDEFRKKHFPRQTTPKTV